MALPATAGAPSARAFQYVTRCALPRDSGPPGAWFFVTPEATGYARFMHSGRSLLVSLCLAATLGGIGVAARAETTLYKWVDQDGITHYSDRPAPGAEQVQIQNPQTYKGARPAAQAPRARNAKTVFKGYTRVEITYPADGETIANTGGTVAAVAAVEPAVQAGHQLWFTLDGTRQTDPAQGLTATLQVERGTHSLEVTITDQSGHDILSSAPVSFIYRQNAAASPPRGPLLPPLKKP
ncbi:MAG TPA: DUF4124 domain-containing protein [Steroidobacteraceae bacterium]|nr:DUF4124 domain-containing protein [Steroidobacteraceae bacterium]